MTADQKVQAILTADANLTARVPAARIKVPGDWQSLERPYIIHYPQVGRVNHTHEGTAALREWDYYTVEVWAATHGEARDIGDLVVLALDGYEDADTQRVAQAQTPTAGVYDTDRKVAHIFIDFQIAGSLT